MIDISGPVALRPRQAERFARLVDDSADATRPDDVALLELVGALRAVPEAPAPSAAFSADLRERLMAEADTALVPDDRQLLLPSPTYAGRARRRASVVAAAAVLVGSTGGLAVAAQGSVQGDPLYGVKRSIEAVSTTMSLSDASRGQEYLDQSRTRLAEVDTLLRQDPEVSPRTEDAVRDTLQRFSGSAAQGSDLLLGSYQRDSSADHVDRVRSFAGSAMDQLSEEAAAAPANLQDAFSQAATLLTDLDQQARVLCAACGASDPLALSAELEPASARGALSELIEPGAVAPAAPARAPQPSAAPERPSTTAPSTSAPAAPSPPSLTGTLGKTLGTVTGQGTTSGATKSSGGSLLKLPGSQSGAPSVIDLDKATKDLTGTLEQTTDGLTSGLGKTLDGGS